MVGNFFVNNKKISPTEFIFMQKRNKAGENNPNFVAGREK
jgi:hypothetical protein